MPCYASSRKEMRILAPKEVLTLPCELRPPLRVPTNFNDWNPALLKPFRLSIHNLHRFLDKMQFVVELNFIQRDDHIIIHKAPLKIRDMESVMNSTKLIGNSNLYAMGPFLSITLNGLTNRGLNFPHFLKHMTPFHGVTFNMTLSPTSNSVNLLLRSA
ncbi:hypothetical protein Tco_0043193 [Tanacetum coccineum]